MSVDAPASAPGPTRTPLGCRVLGCLWNFELDDTTVRWSCARGCGAGSARTFPDAERAFKMASQLQRGGPDALARTIERIFHPLGRR